MKKIVLKISLSLIASSFSMQLFPAAAAAKTPEELQALVKQHTKQKLTPAQRAEEYAKLSSEERTALGGGAAPAEKSFSVWVKDLNDRLKETALYINKVENDIKEDEDTLNKLPATDSVYKNILENNIAASKELLKTYRATLKRTHDVIKTAAEAERITREKKKTGTE